MEKGKVSWLYGRRADRHLFKLIEASLFFSSISALTSMFQSRLEPSECLDSSKHKTKAEMIEIIH